MRIAIKINKTSITAWVVIFLFISCGSNGVFDQYTSLPSQTWNLKNPVVFEFQIKDTIARNNLYINIRNNNDYEFSNLFLITHLNLSDKRKIIDTLEYEMTDKRGHFLGKGLSEKKDNKLFYKEIVHFRSLKLSTNHPSSHAKKWRCTWNSGIIRYYRCRIKNRKIKMRRKKEQISKSIKKILDFHRQWNGTCLTAVFVGLMGVLWSTSNL